MPTVLRTRCPVSEVGALTEYGSVPAYYLHGT